MKLNVTPKEMLALYNVLLRQDLRPRLKYEPGTDPVPDYVYLDQLFGRVRSLIVASIGRQTDDPIDDKKATIDQASAREQAKLDKLKVELIDVDKERAAVLNEASRRDNDFLIPDRDDELTMPVYPSHPRRARSSHHGRKK